MPTVGGNGNIAADVIEARGCGNQPCAAFPPGTTNASQETSLTPSQIDSLNQQLATRLDMLQQYKQAYMNATTPMAEAAALRDYLGQMANIQQLQSTLGSSANPTNQDAPPSNSVSPALQALGNAVYNVGWYLGMVESNLVAQVDGVKSAVLDPLVSATSWLITGESATLPSLAPMQIVPLTQQEFGEMQFLGWVEGQSINVYSVASAVRALPSAIQNANSFMQGLVAIVQGGAGGPGLAIVGGGQHSSQGCPFQP